MRAFADLFTQLDQSDSIHRKVTCLADYFERASERDKLWAIALLSHKRPKRTVSIALLQEWAIDTAGIPDWLFEASYHVAGDLAETIAVLIPDSGGASSRGLSERVSDLIALRDMDEAGKKHYVTEAWKDMDYREKFVFNKLITGGFRVGVSRKLMVRALARHTGLDEHVLMHKLMGDWDPSTTAFNELLLEDDPEAVASRPYPFYLAYALEAAPEDLGSPQEWSAEYKWDGIRCQLIRRAGVTYLWSRGEELVTDKFPELAEMGIALPDGTVIDGELLPFDADGPLSFRLLQKRIGRKRITKKLMDDIPVSIIAYDLLECDGRDLRNKPFRDRRDLLESIVGKAGHERLMFSETVSFDDWPSLHEVRQRSREHGAEGLMIKRLNGTYGVGRKKGDWWKWKVDPLTIDGVLLYAMRGHGRRANLYTDYTFAVWDGKALVPFTKAYTGLTDAELQQIDHFVKNHTIERFGPVRSVEPQLVFEIAFEGIAASTRHKSGIALRFPRMKRWRKDKPAREANTLDDLREMLARFGGSPGNS